MKIIHLFFTFLIAATSEAQSIKSWVFYAKVHDTLVPLSANVSTESDQLSIFSYGDPSAAPTKFSLTQDNYAYTANQNMVGVSDSVFGFGPTVPPTPLRLDNDKKLLNGRFYSCQVSTDTTTHRKHRIFYQLRSPNAAQCFEVHLYLLPDKNGPKGSQVTGNIFEKNEEQDNEITNAVSSGENFLQARETFSGHFSQESSKIRVERTASDNGFEEEMLDHYGKTPREVVAQKKEDPKSLGMAHNWPYAFFAKVHDTMVPLRARPYLHGGVQYNAMWYGNDVGDPVEFEKRGNSVFSINSLNDGYVGIFQQMLIFGPNISAVDLQLDEHGRLSNVDYYSCSSPQDVQLITTYSIHARCFPVKIYLLHSNVGVAKAEEKHLSEKSTGLEKVFEKENNGVLQRPLLKAIKDSLERDESLLGNSEKVLVNVPFWEANKVSQKNEQPSKPKVSLENNKPQLQKPEFHNLSAPQPYLLFVNLEGEMVPLGAKYEEVDGKTYGFLCFGTTISDPPVEFIKENNYALSINTPHDGYLGTCDRILAFGKGVRPTDLRLDQDGMLHNFNYYTCYNYGSFHFITTYRPFPDCFEVKIYLLHDPRDASKAMTKLSNENGSGEKQEEVKKKEESVNRSPPFVFFAKDNGQMLPFTGQIVPNLGLDVTVMLYDTGPAIPVEFILEDGNYARSIGTATDGYFGFCEKLFAFGTRMPRGSLDVDENGKTTTTVFYSCWSNDLEGRVVSPEMQNDRCSEVEIYLKHMSSDSGKIRGYEK